jgi:hypothetical protein
MASKGCILLIGDAATGEFMILLLSDEGYTLVTAAMAKKRWIVCESFAPSSFSSTCRCL